jgi:hypothetical protein
MKKSSKKLENILRIGLTDICENNLKGINGFQWLTHLVDYDRFPESLNIVLIFDKPHQVSSFYNSAERVVIEKNIGMLMQQHQIKIKSLRQLILYDNERDCAAQHNGDWVKRLAAVH